MVKKRNRPNVSIRVYPEILHQAHIAAVTKEQIIGEWLEEAIKEKIAREIVI
jgi:hypothetical protein